MFALGRGTTVAAATLIAVGVLAAPAAAAPMVAGTTSCSTSAATIGVTVGVADDATAYGTVRFAQGVAEGAFSNSPAMTVRVRDAAGKVVVTKRSSDGSLSLRFWRRIGGPGWTVQTTVDNTAAGSCTTPRMPIGVA